MSKITHVSDLYLPENSHHVLRIYADGKNIASEFFASPAPISNAEEREEFYSTCERLALDPNLSKYKDDLLAVRPYYDRRGFYET